jgi:hypothetical protein
MARPDVTIDLTTVADFRAFYSEFADAVKWTDAAILRALHVSIGDIGGCGCSGWGTYFPYSILQMAWFALTAHNLTFDKIRADAVNGTGSASTPYVQSSKSIRDESVSQSIPGFVTGGASAWDYLLSLTPYGIDFLKYRNRAGMGAICV